MWDLWSLLLENYLFAEPRALSWLWWLFLTCILHGLLYVYFFWAPSNFLNTTSSFPKRFFLLNGSWFITREIINWTTRNFWLKMFFEQGDNSEDFCQYLSWIVLPPRICLCLSLILWIFFPESLRNVFAQILTFLHVRFVKSISRKVFFFLLCM